MANITTDRYGFKRFTRPAEWADWERGLEYVEEEGTNAWAEIRDKHGLSPEDMETVTEGEVFWEEVHTTEERPGMPDLNYLAWLARLEGTSPGALLDRVIEAKSRQLDERDEVLPAAPTVLVAAQAALVAYLNERDRWGDVADIDFVDRAMVELREALARAGAL